MYIKPFDCGLLVGRFQDFHIGHESLANMALNICDRLLVLVGSAQEAGTMRNPFDIITRITMIKEIYPQSNVIVRSLSDMTNEDDIRPEWGKYLLKNVKRHIYKLPDIMVYGNDEERCKWFDEKDVEDITEIIIPRSRVSISATQMRELLVANDKETWFKNHNPKLHKYYDRLRSELLATESYGNKIFKKPVIQDLYSKKSSNHDKNNNSIFEDQVWD